MYGPVWRHLKDERVGLLSYLVRVPYSPNVDYRAVARRKARKYGLNPTVFQRQIGVESVGYSPAVISGRTASPAGAQGIAQFMPATARGLGVNPLHPKQALDAAAKLMASYVHKYGSYENALRAYNAGPGAVAASHGYAETNHYVQEILRGHDPGGLVKRQRGGGGSSPARRPAGGGASTSSPAAPAAVPGGTGLASLLAQITGQRPQVQISAPQLPAFTAHAALPAGFTPSTSSWAPSAMDATTGLVNSIGSNVAGQAAGAAGAGGAPAAGKVPRGKTLVIGDSLEVGTFPLLKKMLGGKVHGVAVGGKPSAWGIQQLRQHFKEGRYQNVVFDMGTNDATAADLRRSLHALTQIAGNAQVYVSTVNSPFDQKNKNIVIRAYARNHPNVTLVPWHKISHGGANLPDHIHGDYGQRARVVASALGYSSGGGQGARQPAGHAGLRLGPHGGWGGSRGPVYALFNAFGKPLGLSVTSTKRHNTNPYSGSRSDHDLGNRNAYAIDASNGSAPTPQMDEYAYRVMHALGFKNYRKGTPINVTQGVRVIDGVKYQVIYRGSGRAFGGNHLTHVHVGAHRV